MTRNGWIQNCSKVSFSDQPENIPVELAKYRALEMDEKILEDCLWRTAQKVFHLNIHSAS
jgi:hypothetical protein